MYCLINFSIQNSKEKRIHKKESSFTICLHLANNIITQTITTETIAYVCHVQKLVYHTRLDDVADEFADVIWHSANLSEPSNDEIKNSDESMRFEEQVLH